MASRRYFCLLIAGAIAIAWLALTTPAQAEVADTCGTDLVTGNSACFTNQKQLDQWAQDDLDSSAPPSSAVRSAGAAHSNTDDPTDPDAATSYLLGIVWEDRDKSGASRSFFGDSGCDNDGGWEWEYGTLGQIGWGDRISSFEGHSNCSIKLFEHANYNQNAPGITFGPYASVNYVGDAINDNSLSIRWY